MSLAYMSICPKCAAFKLGPSCKFCNIETIKTPVVFEDWLNEKSSRKKEEIVQHYIDTIIKDTYDPKAREYREANEGGWDMISVPGITCPNCSSGNVQQIGTGERVASVALLGIFSKKINKSYKCRSCGYTW